MKEIVSLDDVVKAIRQYWMAWKYPPTIRELMLILDIKSTQTMHSKLHKLKENGLITFRTGDPRTIHIVGDKIIYKDNSIVNMLSIGFDAEKQLWINEMHPDVDIKDKEFTWLLRMMHDHILNYLDEVD